MVRCLDSADAHAHGTGRRAICTPKAGKSCALFASRQLKTLARACQQLTCALLRPRRCRPGALPRSARVGVLGGGQLGRMLAIAAVRRSRLWPALCAALMRCRRAQAPLDVRVAVLDPTPAAPASVAAAQTVGSFRDAAAVRAFAATVDVLTVEIEHVDAARSCSLWLPASELR